MQADNFGQAGNSGISLTASILSHSIRLHGLPEGSTLLRKLRIYQSTLRHVPKVLGLQQHPFANLSSLTLPYNCLDATVPVHHIFSYRVSRGNQCTQYLLSTCFLQYGLQGDGNDYFYYLGLFVAFFPPKTFQNDSL